MDEIFEKSLCCREESAMRHSSKEENSKERSDRVVVLLEVVVDVPHAQHVMCLWKYLVKRKHKLK
jgi:hypothetical protein